jgi:hypothetical protein
MSTGVNSKTDGSSASPAVTKSTGMIAPPPSLASVFMDEKEDSIDYNALGIRQPSKLTTYWNVPAGERHTGSGVLAFGDCHSEVWKWRRGNILTAKNLSHGSTTIQADDLDARRLATTVPDGDYGP